MKKKILVDEFKNRLATAEHKRRKLAHRSMENTQKAAQGGKRSEMTHKSIRDVGPTEDLTYVSVKSWKEQTQDCPSPVKYISKL